MTSRQEQQEAIYEQDEVLWAKIRGYPWWPAFVDKVHEAPNSEENQYTVFFFGDNMHSKLGAQKLRKFIENYTEFYQKARTHRKLMMSIQKAEEKLKQNDQNVEIFETLRNSIKAKKNKAKSVGRQNSQISEHDLSEHREEVAPDLVKSKTVGYRRKKAQIFQQEESEKESQKEKEVETPVKKVEAIKKAKPNESSQKKQQQKGSEDKKSQKQERPQIKINQKMVCLPPIKLKRGRKSKKQQIFHQKSEQQLPQKVIEQPKESSHQEIQPQIEVEVESSESDSSIEEDKSDDDNLYEKKNRMSVNKVKSTDLRGNTAPRKRGRPKKITETIEDSPPEASAPKQKRPQQIKRKLIHKMRVSPKKIDTPRVLSASDCQIIEKTKKLIVNRSQLINYLSSIDITVNNVKQLLDLDVSNILQDGQLTQQIIDILQILKNALLYKYFPDDIKYKKKYEKLLRKKTGGKDNSNDRERLRYREREKQEQMDEERDEQDKEKDMAYEDQEIRKKTIVKLEKFLKLNPQIAMKAKQAAVKIEAYFEKADDGIGDKYRSMAYKVLKNLKEKKESFSQVMKNLDQNAYD